MMVRPIFKAAYKFFRRKYTDISKKYYISIPSIFFPSPIEKIVSFTTVTVKANLCMKIFKQQEAQSIVLHGKTLVCPNCGPKKFYSTALSLPSLVLIGQTALQTASLVNSVGDWSGL
jgi:hypothetical protein